MTRACRNKRKLKSLCFMILSCIDFLNETSKFLIGYKAIRACKNKDKMFIKIH